MNELPGLPPVSVDRGASASAPDPTEDLEGDIGRDQAFDDALENSGDLHESQAPETRRAIKGTLDRLATRQDVHSPRGQEAAQGGPDRTSPDGGNEAGSADKPVSPTPPAAARNREPAEVPRSGHAKASAPETAPSRVGKGDGRPSVPGPASGRPGSGNPAANRLRTDDADPSNRGLPVGSTRVGASDGSAPGNAALDVPGQEKLGRQAQRLRGSPDARSQVDRPQRASPSEDRIQSGREGEASTTQESTETKAREPDDAEQPDPQSADLTGLATPAGVPEPQGVAAPEAAPLSAPRAAELAGQVADRILVSVPEAETSGEVRISLKESVLDGSDVRIFREDGELRIVFLARTEAAGKFLADNGTALQQALGERLGDERVRVEVESPAGTGTGADQQDNEGRSRQQYVAPDNQPDGD